MSWRIISVSAAPYDGYPAPVMLDSLASCEVTHVEPAFIVGYTEPFDESSFSNVNLAQWKQWLADAGISCHAMSSHIDLGDSNAVQVFQKRMDFARGLGAEVINTNAAARAKLGQFMINIDALAKHAEDIGLRIGLENPGDGSDNVLNTAVDANAVLSRIDYSSVGLNYDAGNTVSHRPDTDSLQDALRAMPFCVHTHIKDVRRAPEGYFFTPFGEGDAGCAAIVQDIAGRQLNLSIEMPLRLYRGPDAKPVRSEACIPLADIESHIRAALSFVQHHLDAAENTV